MALNPKLERSMFTGHCDAPIGCLVDVTATMIKVAPGINEDSIKTS